MKRPSVTSLKPASSSVGGGDQADVRSDRKPLAVDRVLGLIAEIATSGGCSLSELSRRMQIPKTSLLNLLPAMVEGGYLAKDQRRYVLGAASYSLASVIERGKFDPVKTAEPFLQRLALDADKTVTLAILADNERMVLHVAKAEPPDAMRFAVSVGTLSPVYTTAAGRVMLAFGPRAWVEDYLTNAQLASRTTRTIIDRDQLLTSAEQVRQKGYAVTRGETYDTVGAIAAPVFDEKGLAFALIAAGAVEKIVRQEEMLSILVRRTADQISQKLQEGNGSSSMTLNTGS